jgi:large subunit ribosomal protein L24
MIKKNDNVIVITGGDKGKKGKVIQVLRTENKVIIEGVNIKKRHSKAKGSKQPGQIIEVAGPINLSNVKLVDAPKKSPAKPKKS